MGKLLKMLALTTICFSVSGFADPRPQSPEPMSGRTPLEFLRHNDIQMGWNLGNTLDAVNNARTLAEERAWGNPLTTQQTLDGVRASGFDMIRIPCTWIGHIGAGPNFTLSQARLQRVAEIVEMAKTAGFKAIIINIHHDGNYTSPPNTWGFLDFATAVTNNTRKMEIQNQLARVWTQIAEYFRNYGDYLIFETLNEIHQGNWGFGDRNSAAFQHQEQVLFDWNQAALNAIRATGGNNATRFVAVPGLGSTEPETVLAAHARGRLLPNDGTNGTSRLMVSVHYYHPAQYTVAEAENHGWPLIHTWGSASERAHAAREMGNLKTTFLDRGIAVYVGEWGAPTHQRSSMSQQIRDTHVDYIRTVAAAILANGVLPVYWDDGGNFRLLERSNGRAPAGFKTDVLNAMLEGVTGNPTAIQTNRPAKSINAANATITNRQINLSLPTTANNANIALFDIRGRQIFEQNVAINGGLANIALPRSIAKNQTAILQVKTNSGFNMSKKVLVK